jgi:hypothetical protein
VPKSKRKITPESKTTRASRKSAKRRTVRPKARSRRAAKPRESRPEVVQHPVPVEQPSPEHEKAYVETLIQSGQAAHLTKDGKLPPGATHKIVDTENGEVKVVRRRFSIA